MSANKNGIKSELARMDACVNTAEDYAEIPEMTDESFERADHNRGGVPHFAWPWAAGRFKQGANEPSHRH